MSTEHIDNAEERIMLAAKQIFERQGYDGTSMQQIADAAKINKAMLHYYYRSKEKLFDQVFQRTFAVFLDSVGSVFESNLPYLEKIRSFITCHTDFLMNNQHLPSFILSEINRRPEKITEILDLNHNDKRFAIFFAETISEINAGRIRQTDPRQLLVNVLALNIFPIAASPIIKTMLNFTDDEYRQFMTTRKETVFNIIKNMLEVR